MLIFGLVLWLICGLFARAMFIYDIQPFILRPDAMCHFFATLLVLTGLIGLIVAPLAARNYGLKWRW